MDINEMGLAGRGWEAFRETATGHRDLVVPVLGTGFRRWLLRDLAYPDAMVDWKALLRAVAHEKRIPCPPLDDGATALALAWDDIVARCPEVGSRHTSEVEDKLLKQVVALCLDGVSQKLLEDPRVKDRGTRFLGLGFKDVVDLSLDPLLTGFEARTESFRKGHRQKTTDRFVVTPTPADSVTVWMPHGSTMAPDRVVLGVQRYGRAVSGMISAFENHKRWERLHPLASPINNRTLRDLNQHRGLAGYDAAHWVPHALNAPLLLLGTGLGPDEWDLRWFLQMRRRNHARLPVHGRPVTYRLTCHQDKGLSPGDAQGLGIVPLHGGATWDEAWKRLDEVLDQRPR